MLCDKGGAGIFRFSYFIGKFLGLLALEYDFKKKIFKTSMRATLMSSVICILVAVISPFLVKLNSELYLVSGVDIDEKMLLIFAAQFGFDILTSLVVLACQLWKRNNVCGMAKTFQKVVDTLSTEMGYSGNIITPEMILLIAIKFSITLYELVINFPYIVIYGDIISPECFVGFFLYLYVAEIAAVFSDIVFAAMLLLARYFYLLDEILKELAMEIQTDDVLTQMQIREIREKLYRLTFLYGQLGRLVDQFARCTEVSILVQMLHTSANMLTNLYALLDFYVEEKYLTKTDLVYTLMIFLNICLLIHAAERIKRSSDDLRNTFLDLDASTAGWRSDVLVFKIWPEVHEVDVLGMFPLNNTFLLFLIVYATDFVVIILQSIMIKYL